MPPIHDRLFKTLLRTFFRDFLRLTVPAVARQIRLERPAFLDKELFTGPGGERREADLLARVPLRRGGRPMLIHVEVEARARAGMPRRLRSYHWQIQARHDCPVLSIVLYLKAGPPGIAAECLNGDLDGPEVNGFRYIAFGLAGCSATEYLEKPEPLAWGLAALMNPGPMSRAEHKLACLRRIAVAEMREDHRFLLVNCVETYLELSPEEMTEYNLCSEGSKESQAMEMTWADKMMAKGRKEGVREERGRSARTFREVLLRLLDQKFGPLPAITRRRVERIVSVERLARLTEQVLAAPSLEEMGLR